MTKSKPRVFVVVVVLASRRAIRSERTQKLILELEEADVQVHLVQADVSVESDVAKLLAACPKPLRGIIHAAGVLDDGILSDCVYLVLYLFYGEEKLDFFVLGINCGVNMGEDITYLGIVVGVMEVVFHGVLVIVIF